MKTCTVCLESKDLSKFAKRSNGYLRGRCTPCLNAYHREYAKSHKKAVRAAKAKWAKKNAKAISERKTERYRSDPEYRKKVSARWKLALAIKRGLVVRQPCGKCGSGNSHGHHHDYDKALEVEWLCLKCHLLEHGVAV